MKIQIAVFAGLVLTLGTAMSAVAIQSDRDMKTAEAAVAVTGQQTDATEIATASQVRPTASKILILPRPL